MTSSQESLAVLFPDAGFFAGLQGAHSHIRGLGLDDALDARMVSQANLKVISSLTIQRFFQHEQVWIFQPLPIIPKSWLDGCCTWCGDGRDLDFQPFSMRSGSETRRGWSGRTVPGPVLMTFFGWFWLGSVKMLQNHYPPKLYKAENLKIRHVFFSE